MELWKGSVHRFNGTVCEFVGTRETVREWLTFEIRRASCGVVYVKPDVHRADGLSWDSGEIRYMFYRRGFVNRIIWEEWGRQKRIVFPK